MNRLKSTSAALLVAVFLLLSASPARAGEGHDHGEAPTAAGPSLPRFTAVSELFELVGVVNGKQITLYLDRYTDGSPVKDARLELELGGIKIPVMPHAEGEFEATLAQDLKPGAIAVAATVMAGEETDLLAGELDLHETTALAETHGHGWQEYLTWGLAGVAGLALLIVVVRRLRASRNNVIGGAA